jgi:endonuclease YncB( thermonuclease family)
MWLTKSVCVLLVSILLSVCVVAQTINLINSKVSDKQGDNSSRQFAFSFSGIVTKVIDGCTVEIEIKEGRRGKIQGQELEMPSNTLAYNGSKVIRLVNTKCVVTDKVVCKRAKEMLTQVVKGKLVEVFFKNYADIKKVKIVGQLIVAESGQDVGLEQLKNGLVRFCNDTEKTISESDKHKYKNAEKSAKQQKIGIWVPARYSRYQAPRLPPLRRRNIRGHRRAQ